MPRIWATVGVSPRNADGYTDEVEQAIREAASNKAVCAIGCCGLASPVTDAQAHAFKRQVALAFELKMPLVIEVREAHEQARDLLDAAGFAPERVLVRVCDASCDEIESWSRWGAYLAFDGRLANNPQAYAGPIAAIPSERVLVESGAPEVVLDALPGYPARPDQVVFVAHALASLIPPEQLTENMQRFYGI